MIKKVISLLIALPLILLPLTTQEAGFYSPPHQKIASKILR